MLSAAIVMFREVLEAALIVGIVLASTRGVPGRGYWVGAGVGAGLLGACLVAGFADVIANAAAGVGQEVMNATILLIAVVMLSWHQIWMSRHSKEMTREMAAVADAVTTGKRPHSALAVVVGVAVMREGSEAVLFLYGIGASDPHQAGPMFLGGILGTLGGIAMGAALYWGLVAIPVRRLFQVTGAMIVLLAAGLASQAASYLVQADLLPPLGDGVWNTSDFLSEGSILGRILHTLIGYSSRPDGIQIVFYLATIVAILGMSRLVNRPGASRGANASWQRASDAPAP